MSIGKDFPISEYYQDNIVDGITLSRVAGWWTAILIIKDPKSEKKLLNIYQWQFTESGWKVRKSFSFKKQKDFDAFIAASGELVQKFPLG